MCRQVDQIVLEEQVNKAVEEAAKLEVEEAAQMEVDKAAHRAEGTVKAPKPCIKLAHAK